MIIGRIADLATQRKLLHPVLVDAIETCCRLDPMRLAIGRHDIDGDLVFLLVQDTVPRLVEESLIEAHATYADIQIPLGAVECFGFALPQTGLESCDDQLETGDIAFYPAPQNECFIDVEPGSYIVFLPGELHRPSIALDGDEAFRKVVIKVHRTLLCL